jgi:hypothetical protein
MGDLDIDGTKLMAAEIYTNFTNNGGKSFLLGNRVAGYCVPHSSNSHNQGNKSDISSDISSTVLSENKAINAYNNPSSAVDNNMQERQSSPDTTIIIPQQSELDFINTLSDEIGMKVISTIPCYCDIQFTRREFLTVLRYPEHPFAKQIEELIKAIQTLK